MTGVLLRRGDTQRERPRCEDGDRDWSDASTIQRLGAKGCRYPHRKRGRGTASPSEPPEGTDPAEALTSEFRPPEWWGECISVVEAQSLW